MKHSSSLNAARRARELAALPDETLDLLVVGLGVTGAGIALDAASRGLRVAAVDAHDLAFGTSRWSSKLIHGGLRYLGAGQAGVAREMAVERGLLMGRIAPHLVRAAPFVLPLTPLVSPGRSAMVRAAFRAGDLLRLAARTPRGTLPAPRRLSAVETLRLAPALRPYGLRGGLLSWDGQLSDDARLVVALGRTAAAHGARVLTRCRALRLAGDGALLRDELTGAELPVRARAVVNAAGVWAGDLAEGVRLRPSRGTHLVLRAESLGGLLTGMHLPVPGESSRFILVIPQDDGRVYVGLTDEPVDGPVPDVPEPTEPEIGFLLDIIDSALEVPVHRSDVVGAFAGLRPLIDDERHGSDTAAISRRHAVFTSRDGVITAVGGKLTTYRALARQAVDAVVDRAAPDAGRCRTARLPLVGAAPPSALSMVDAPRRLVRRYGTEAPLVLAAGEIEPVAPGSPVLRAELSWAVRHEGALDSGDLLDRRTRIGLVPEDRAAALPATEEALHGEPQEA